MEKRTNILTLIWFFLKPHKIRLLVLSALALMVGGLDAATVAAIYPIVSTAFDTGASQGNLVLSLFGAVASLLPVADQFIAFCVVFLILAILAFAVKLAYINFRSNFVASLVRKNQSEIFSKFINADYQYFIDHKQGELIYNVGGAPTSLSALVVSIAELVAQGILFISVVLLLLSLSWPGTLAVLLMALGYYYFTRYLGKKVSYYSGKREMEAAREGSVILNEAITGIKQVKVFVTGEHWIDRFVSTMKKRWYHFVRREVWQQIPSPVLMLVMYLSVGIIAWTLRIAAPGGFMALIPLIGTFAFAVFRLVPALSATGNSLMNVMGVLPNCELVYSIQNDNITHIKDGEQEFGSLKSGIQFDNISFAYKGRKKTLEDVSVNFERGRTTAVVGRSGSGKTTIINLILRLFEPEKGEILVVGENLKRYKLASWLNNIGLVSQDTFIFNDTVENNITFRQEGYSREDVINAARFADAHSFITELPDGYDTYVGDKGTRLSGGQAQRIAVARAMIRNPEILIFDEATNNLDNISEAAVQKAIDELSKDHTVIIIAHRLSTIANADKVIVLENGRVVEEGTYHELMEKRGAYWGLYQGQPANARQSHLESEDI
ncbi:MAG: ABC transporter ATP-binding protein [Dehalococcoidales bacterium]|nr:ABC transporter ATP-binding protein [Dehalococcoidales bacterium]